MEKSNLGISLGLLGAILCFASLFGGYIPAVIIVGYILLKEENAWIRTLALRVMGLLIAVSVITTGINLIPDCWGWIGSIVRIFADEFPSYKLNQIINVFTSCLSILKTIMLLALGFKALKCSTVKIPVVDSQVSKYM